MNYREVDYVTYKHSYAHALQPKLKTLNYQANVLKKPANYVKKMVMSFLGQPDVRWTEKEQLFYDTVMSMADGRNIYYYCRNAVNKAKEIRVMVDEDGDMVEF